MYFMIQISSYKSRLIQCILLFNPTHAPSADVASFIPPFSALDVEAGTRATSVYLVQRVIPMLPSLLCEELCRCGQKRPVCLALHKLCSYYCFRTILIHI